MAVAFPVSLLQPNLALQDNILKLSPDLIKMHGLKGLILDVDDTLVPTWDREVPVEVLEWLNEMKSVVDLWLVSNNVSHSRIRRIATAMDLPYLLRAGKPSRRKIRQAAESMNLPLEQIAMVGDRVFTDVLAGNRLGMFTILVRPMGDPTRFDQKLMLRSFEIWLSKRLGATLAPGA
jgi:uncharacterized protein